MVGVARGDGDAKCSRIEKKTCSRAMKFGD